MKFVSTRNNSLKVSLKEAVLKGLSPDGGLFMPEKIPNPGESFYKNIHKMTLREIANVVAKLYAGDIPVDILEKIVDDALNFEAPITALKENDIYVLELFHGPTLAFKDFGARFMARLMNYYVKSSGMKLNVLVATSGDTGSAVADGFYGVEDINVIILYPSGKVSPLQEKQIATLGKNIKAIEVDGTFDDCQRFVKKAFLDVELKEKLLLTSANSINIARLIPQSFYYFYAFGKLASLKKKIVVSVPCGNIGNLTAGILAKKGGASIYKFIASTNANDVFTRFIESGYFKPKKAIKTLSNAMDVGNPSNLERVRFIYRNNISQIKKDVVSHSFNDEETIDSIKEVYEKYGYILDPHGAVAFAGLVKYLGQKKDTVGIFLETAHAAKFKDIIENVLNISISLPAPLQESLLREKQNLRISNNYDAFKALLIDIGID